MAQYAADIAVLVNATLRKHSLRKHKRVVNHVQKLYQSELSKWIAYMEENGFELSRDKTCLMLFKNGENLKHLPQRELNGQL